ncbi:MAG: sigma-70 family RNA polymerase sigma factor [Ruminococcaceae bacterium]|nr:sigma-70 family RNA polymerase sigma factor [Oscillospiraceae bacterium]
MVVRLLLLTLITTLDPLNGDLLKRLIDEHSDKLYAVAYGIVHDSEDAKDVVQETFISVWLTIRNFYKLEREDTIALLVKYTQNKAKDHLRRRKSRVQTIPLIYEDDDGEKDFVIPDYTQNPEEQTVAKEALKQLAAYVDQLPDTQRDVIEMRYKYGMSESEIAQALSISESAVSSRLNRAKNSLQKMRREKEDE